MAVDGDLPTRFQIDVHRIGGMDLGFPPGGYLDVGMGDIKVFPLEDPPGVQYHILALGHAGGLHDTPGYRPYLGVVHIHTNMDPGPFLGPEFDPGLLHQFIAFDLGSLIGVDHRKIGMEHLDDGILPLELLVQFHAKFQGPVGVAPADILHIVALDKDFVLIGSDQVHFDQVKDLYLVEFPDLLIDDALGRYHKGQQQQYGNYGFFHDDVLWGKDKRFGKLLQFG